MREYYHRLAHQLWDSLQIIGCIATHLDRQVTTREVSHKVVWREEDGTYTSEVEGTLKCEGEYNHPYIQEGMVCAHIVFKTRVA